MAGSVTGAVLGVVVTGPVFAGRVVLGAVLSCAGATVQPVRSRAKQRNAARTFDFIRDTSLFGMDALWL